MQQPNLLWLDTHQPLPSADQAWSASTPYPGLLAAGGDLSTDRLVDAYSRGIFPWFNDGEPILWWSTDPRMVLRPTAFKLHASLRKMLRALLKHNRLRIEVDANFQSVIAQCARVNRAGQVGTWINARMQDAYGALHLAGHAHCISAWVDAQCVGGLYWVNIGKLVCGESMFSLAPNGSKLALAALVALCLREQVALIDCQQVTAHLASLGAAPIKRDEFLLHAQCTHIQPKPAWTFQPSDWTLLDNRLA